MSEAEISTCPLAGAVSPNGGLVRKKLKTLPHRAVHKVGMLLLLWSRRKQGKSPGVLLRLGPSDYHYCTQKELRKLLEEG
jgi:hypothetical protein